MPKYCGSISPLKANQALDGLTYAGRALEFAALGRISESGKKFGVSINLYSVALELALKSLALRSGVDVQECGATNHNISKTVALIQRKGTEIPKHLIKKINNDKAFKSRLFGTRYPTVFQIHPITRPKDQFETILEILEIPAMCPLVFLGGSSRHETLDLIRLFQSAGVV